MEKLKLLFLDMDGVLADMEGGCDGDLNKMYEPRFFANLKPIESNISETIEQLQEDGYIVKILSKAPVNRNHKRFRELMLDKVEWIQDFAPTVDELDICIQAANESKGDILKMYNLNIVEATLVDDYTPNLIEWSFNGGVGIKKAKRIKNGRLFKQILSLKELADEGVI